MFDKVIIKARIDIDDIDTIVLRNYLEQCTEGDELFYKSTAYANFDGCFIEVRGDALKCKCSINKLYEKEQSGKLDNSKPMTFRNAVRTINALLCKLCVKPENAVVTYYEVGVTMVMPRPATEYISLAEEVSGRVLWNDANFPVDRQKTTEKSKYFRKVLKIYDKTFEGESKGRKVGKNILRVESVYRHQQIQLLDLISTETMAKIGRTNAADYLDADKPLLLISFARSGNSPESVATVNLANKVCKNVAHIFITCNKNGHLAKSANAENILSLLLPEETDDKSLAMTSSFSTMLLTCLMLSKIDTIENEKEAVAATAANAQVVLDEYAAKIQAIAARPFERGVFLGSGPMKGIAEECHLKLQELTDGGVVCKFD